jgi:hypothetical protein
VYANFLWNTRAIAVTNGTRQCPPPPPFKEQAKVGPRALLGAPICTDKALTSLRGGAHELQAELSQWVSFDKHN